MLEGKISKRCYMLIIITIIIIIVKFVSFKHQNNFMSSLCCVNFFRIGLFAMYGFRSQHDPFNTHVPDNTIQFSQYISDAVCVCEIFTGVCPSVLEC